MQQIIECVPNFSEGRRQHVVDQIVDAITSVPGTTLLDQTMDANHNRSVITFVGDVAAVEDAAFRACAQAAELIDLDAHRGEHPRIGATDVIPFIPIRGATQDDCIAIARRLGERVGRELGIPVYLYEDAATKEKNRNLADVRRGEYEGLRVEIESNPDRAPDYGPRKLGKAGAVAIGARFPLIAYNVNLATSDIAIAKQIAKTVRFSSGGLPFVKALGIKLADRQIVQVSMNLTRYDQTPLHLAFEMVKREAERFGVNVIESEIVGLVPQQALNDSASYYLRLAYFSRNQILEARLDDALDQSHARETRTEFLDQLAAPVPAPGGGSAAAYAGALAAALVMMFAGLTLAKKSYEPVHFEMKKILSEAAELKNALSAAVEQDAQAYARVLAAYKLPKDSSTRDDAIQEAMQGAAAMPLRVGEMAARVMQLAQEARGTGLKSAASDVTVAMFMAHAAIKSAALNVRTNLETITDEKFAAEYRTRIAILEKLLTQE